MKQELNHDLMLRVALNSVVRGCLAHDQVKRPPEYLNDETNLGNLQRELMELREKVKEREGMSSYCVECFTRKGFLRELKKQYHDHLHISGLKSLKIPIKRVVSVKHGVTSELERISLEEACLLRSLTNLS